jgi:hypothetical protein
MERENGFSNGKQKNGRKKDAKEVLRGETRTRSPHIHILLPVLPVLCFALIASALLCVRLSLAVNERKRKRLKDFYLDYR